ncbi:MAG: NADH-quinone oxidoreductase [Longicatena sp.]
MDERQQQIRGSIAMQTVVITIVWLMLAAFVNDFGLLDIEQTVGLSSFLIASVVGIVCFISVSFILRDAYIGVAQESQLRICLGVFTLLAIAEDVFTTLDLINGEGVSIVSFTSVIMVNSIAICLWIKRKDWK